MERGFSTMGRVKSDERNRLNSSSLDHLMRISLDGQHPSVYSSARAADKFFTTGNRRPNIQPYKAAATSSGPSEEDD